MRAGRLMAAPRSRTLVRACAGRRLRRAVVRAKCGSRLRALRHGRRSRRRNLSECCRHVLLHLRDCERGVAATVAPCDVGAVCHDLSIQSAARDRAATTRRTVRLRRRPGRVHRGPATWGGDSATATGARRAACVDHVGDCLGRVPGGCPSSHPRQSLAWLSHESVTMTGRTT